MNDAGSDNLIYADNGGGRGRYESGEGSVRQQLSYDEFFRLCPKYNKPALRELPALRRLFDFIVSKEDELVKVTVEKDLPAVCGLTPGLEEHHAPEAGLDLKNHLFLKQLIGAVVGEIMKRRGFARFASRNISPGKSAFFSAGALYKPASMVGGTAGRPVMSRFPVPDYDSQRKKALEFAEFEDLARKIARLIAPEARRMNFRLPFDEYSTPSERRLRDCRHPRDGVDFFFEDDGAERVFFCAAQIAIALELDHPGISAAAGLKFAPDNDAPDRRGLKRFFYFTGLVEELLEDSAAAGICEKRLLADWFSPAFICRFDGRDHIFNAAGSSVPIYRMTPRTAAAEGSVPISPALARQLQEIERTGNFLSALAGRKFLNGVNEFIREALESIESAEPEGCRSMVSTCQLAIAAAEALPGNARTLPVKLLENALLRSAAAGAQAGPAENKIELAALSLSNIEMITFSYSEDFGNSLEAPGLYLPLAARRKAPAKD